MREAALYVLRARLQGGILSKARRAALKLHLPVGFCYAEAREAAEQHHPQDQARLSVTAWETMMALLQEVTRFWCDPRTTARERKRVVRLLIEDVTRQKGDHILAPIRCKGGATRTLTGPWPPPFAQSR